MSALHPWPTLSGSFVFFLSLNICSALTKHSSGPEPFSLSLILDTISTLNSVLHRNLCLKSPLQRSVLSPFGLKLTSLFHLPHSLYTTHYQLPLYNRTVLICLVGALDWIASPLKCVCWRPTPQGAICQGSYIPGRFKQGRREKPWSNTINVLMRRYPRKSALSLPYKDTVKKWPRASQKESPC